MQRNTPQTDHEHAMTAMPPDATRYVKCRSHTPQLAKTHIALAIKEVCGRGGCLQIKSVTAIKVALVMVVVVVVVVVITKVP